MENDISVVFCGLCLELFVVDGVLGFVIVWLEIVYSFGMLVVVLVVFVFVVWCCRSG